MKYYCTLLGKNCIQEECSQFDRFRVCKLYTNLGRFLIYSSSPIEFGRFVKYLENLRPTELSDGGKEEDRNVA